MSSCYDVGLTLNISLLQNRYKECDYKEMKEYDILNSEQIYQV